MFDAVVRDLSQESEDKFIRQTTQGETILIEQLLELDEGVLGVTFAKFPKGAENCPNCGRQNSLHDIATGGTNLHGKSYIRAALLGRYGYSVNKNDGPGAFYCLNCGLKRQLKAGFWSSCHATQAGI